MWLALVLIPVVVGVALSWWTSSRVKAGDGPTLVNHEAPSAVNVDDFTSDSFEVLVVVFSSATCEGCHGVLARASVLMSEQVVVIECEHGESPKLHKKYGITAVPTTVLVTPDGHVARDFIGDVTSTHLWGAVAEIRSPGSAPSCGGVHNDEQFN